jgi:hypothetical protein
MLLETTDNSCIAVAIPDFISENIHFSYLKIRSKFYAIRTTNY